MACSRDNLGKADLSGSYRPEPRLHSYSRRAIPAARPDSQAAAGKDQDRDISITRTRVSWPALAVVELPLLALLLMVLSISALVSPDFELRASGASVPLLYTCPFFALTGIPCLFCGMTRSFLAMGGFDFGQSLSYHPLGPVLFFLSAGLALTLTVSVITRNRFHLSISPALRRRLVTSGAVLLLGAWIIKVIVWRETGLL